MLESSQSELNKSPEGDIFLPNPVLQEAIPPHIWPLVDTLPDIHYRSQCAKDYLERVKASTNNLDGWGSWVEGMIRRSSMDERFPGTLISIGMVEDLFEESARYADAVSAIQSTSDSVTRNIKKLNLWFPGLIAEGYGVEDVDGREVFCRIQGDGILVLFDHFRQPKPGYRLAGVDDHCHLLQLFRPQSVDS